MSVPFQKGLPRLIGKISPGIFTIFLILFIRVPFEDSDAGMYIPIFSLAFTYYFRLHYPRSGRLWFIFLLGLLEDYLSGGYLGLTPLVLLMVAAIFERQGKVFLQGTFLSEIIIFTFFSMAFSVVYWSVASFIEVEFLRILPFFTQGFITALVYPIYVFLVGRISKRFSI
ncbi:MAG: rod shape-determining protein MreD [Alphaproteobacteria bacterium]